VFTHLAYSLVNAVGLNYLGSTYPYFSMFGENHTSILHTVAKVQLINVTLSPAEMMQKVGPQCKYTFQVENFRFFKKFVCFGKFTSNYYFQVEFC
jgi:hypothetical protein